MIDERIVKFIYIIITGLVRDFLFAPVGVLLHIHSLNIYEIQAIG